MQRVAKDDINRVLTILDEAEAIGGLEAEAILCYDSRLEDYTKRMAPKVPMESRMRFIKLSDSLRKRMRAIRHLQERGVGESRILGTTPVRGISVRYLPYAVEFSLPESAYAELCRRRNLKDGYASDSGLCLATNDIEIAFRENIGGCVTIINASKGSKSITRKHEMHHAFQNTMMDAGYPFSPGVGADLLSEEAAECLAEGPGDYRDREVLVHTNFYVKHDVDEDDFPRLARTLYTAPQARRLISQRQRTEDALLRAYETADRNQKRTLGFCLDLIPFRTAHTDLKIISTYM